MRISATPDIAGNEQAVEELKAGLASAVAVAIAESDLPAPAPSHAREPWPDHDVVAQATADAAPHVAELLETAIAERLARRRIYTEIPRATQPSAARRPR